MELTLEGGAARGTPEAARGRERLLRRHLGRRRPRRPAQRPRGAGAARLDRRVLARLAARRRLPRPPLADPPAALGPGPQGPHLHADRGDRRRPDHLAAGDAGRRTQLGLPLQLDPRLDLQPLGPAHARLRPGGARLHALHRQRLPDHPDLQIMYGIGGEKELTESTLDHLCGYGGAQPVRIGNGAFDQRQNDVWGALLDSIYLHEKALQGQRHAGRPRADPLPGGSGDRRLAESRPGDLGVARRAPALRLLEADDLGRGRPRRPPRPQHRLRRARRRVAARRPTRSRPRSSSAASATASSASTTRPTRSTPRCC